MPKLVAGQLVEIQKLPHGERGQLVQWDEEHEHWNVATFGTSMIFVKEEFLRPLSATDLQDIDLALGPASSMHVMGLELTACLASKGYAVCRLFVAPEDLDNMVATADRCVHESAFARLAADLEPGYLGKNCMGKVLAIDMDNPDIVDFVKDSALRIGEEAMSSVGSILRPFTYAELGFNVYSRSTSMLALPLEDDEDDCEAPDLENEDAAAFLTMLWRAKVMVILNAGPSDSVLTLFPKAGGGDMKPKVAVEPGMLVVFSMDRYGFSFKPQGKALSLSSFFLDEPKEYAIDKVYGDLSHITGSISGPLAPPVEHISVVSLGMRYPSSVDEPCKLWVGYGKSGWDAVQKHPYSRWDCDEYYQEGTDSSLSGKSYTCHCSYYDGIELFDCKFFDISPMEARGMDPSQRQVLEVSYLSLLGAGFSKSALSKKAENIACFVGLDKNEWGWVPKEVGASSSSSGANAITSNRFNYCLNLKGASMTIDTACSSSLVAQHTGKLYLLFKHFDPVSAVIVCGVNLTINPGTYISCCAAGMHSHVGRCFTYNASADGYTRGEATASTGIKLKSFDKEDGDHSLIVGSQVNQDGRSASLTAPNGPAQERCAAAVIKEVGMMTSEVDTTECHGTGTSLGDPIEIGAYKKIMAKTPREEPVVVTSSKSNIGHCEGSAGVSGFIKCVLLCVYAEGTPNCHMRALNPHLDIQGFPAVLLTEGIVFRAEASYNGVLSFGFGGTNASAMVWGSNQMTSRSLANKNIQSIILNRISQAPAQEVTITGDDWEEWEIDFPTRDPKSTDKWDVEIDEDGMVTYLKQDTDAEGLAREYFLTGTFNDWGQDPLVASSDVPGLFIGDILVGPEGLEEFQVLVDKDPAMTFYPEVPHCSTKSVPVRGPGETTRESSWCVTGDVGDRFHVEFYISESRSVSILWFREGLR